MKTSSVRRPVMNRFALLAALACVAWIPLQSPQGAGTGKTVLLDCYYNNEWRLDSGGRPARFHYVWDDTANSGFSQLAARIAGTGARLDTLASPPSAAALHRAAIYVIVDPDTPRETEDRHVLDEPAAEEIVSWVRDGGVLLLMGNDSANADLKHLNLLASRFGIRFNEDSRNRVTGNRFDIGTFDLLPDHPVFDGVRRIFIKELSTLSLSRPAVGFLTDGTDVIMASSRLGRGTVVAVGDPWLYNEYMDTRRLPEGYDNARAGENLFKWLLGLARPGR